MFLSIHGIHNNLSNNLVQGFNTKKIQNIKISSDDISKYGINIDEFNKVDTNQDGLITANEFLSSGLNIASIFNAFKQEATQIDGAYINDNNMDKNNSNNQNKFNNPTQQYTLNHPSFVNHPYLGQNLDSIA